MNESLPDQHNLPTANVSVAILAGGQSRRMGQDKSFADLAGRPLFEHTLERVSRLGLPVHIITNTPERYAPYSLPMYADAILGKGSLGGIYTALLTSQTPWTLCVACDMPFLDVSLMEYLLAQRGECDAVVPVVDERAQGLHALYNQSCLGPIYDALVHDDLKIQRLLPHLSVTYIARTQLDDFDLRSFMNVNTPEELAQAQLHHSSRSVAQG